MAEKKITKREQFEKVVAILEEQEQTELVTFIQHEIELLDKKKSSKKKQSLWLMKSSKRKRLRMIYNN